MNIKESFKKEWPFMLLFSLNILAVVFFYQKLPEQIPTHWNIRGEIDGWGGKGSLLLFSALPLGIYLLMTIMPAIDPRRRNYDQFQKSYFMVKVTMGLLFSAIVTMMILSSLGMQMNFPQLIPGLFGVFFVIMGNYLSTVKQNYFLGIRTPWALASKENWDKTHRLSGKVWVGTGLLMVLFSVFGQPVISFVTLFVAVIIPYIYSFVLFKKGI